MQSVEVYVKRTTLVLGFTCLFFLSLFAARPTAAQTAGTGTISGTITDPSNAAIAAATVEVRDAIPELCARCRQMNLGLYYAPFLAAWTLRRERNEGRVSGELNTRIFCWKLDQAGG